MGTTKRGAPRRYDARTSTCIRFPEELHARLQAAAAERDVSMNYLVTKAVEKFIDHLVPVDEMRWTRG